MLNSILAKSLSCDASASSVFAGKRRRMAVGAAGIAVELFLAAFALLVWLAVEPGWVRHVAYAVMLVGGVSTLLFNGNPLLRFDGYYVLADWLEIPNLSSKASQYLAAVSKRVLLGLRQVQLPDSTRRSSGVSKFRARSTCIRSPTARSV